MTSNPFAFQPSGAGSQADAIEAGWDEELAWLNATDIEPPPSEEELAKCQSYPDWWPMDGALAGEGMQRDGEVGAAATSGFAPTSWTAGFADGGVLDGLAPDPVLATFAWDACEAGIGKLTDDELIGLLLATRRLGAQQAAMELAAVAELDGRRTSGRACSSRDAEHVAAELAAALALTGRAADSLLGLARGLVRLPMVWAALFGGRIDRARAEVFACELAALDDATARACATAFTGQAGQMTTGQLRTALRALVASIDPAAAAERARRGRDGARVESWAEGSGNHALAGRELDPADAIAADARIAAIARSLKQAGAPGTLDQLRAAVFTALLAGRDPGTLLPPPGPAGDTHRGGVPAAGAGHREPPAGAGDSGYVTDHHAPPPTAGLSGLSGSVHLTMPLATWLGTCGQPGHAAGHGPASAPTCRDLADRLAAAGRARWCLTLTHPDGTPAAHACAPAGPGRRGPPTTTGTGPPTMPGHDPPPGTTGWLAAPQLTWLEHGTCTHLRQADAYRPPARLAHLVRIRQRTCCFPGCRRPATACDLDHTTPYQNGGITCECNLAPLCRRHHRAKQAPGWHLAQPQPGVLTWTLPHGRTHRVTPEPYAA